MSNYNEEEGLIPTEHTVLEEKAETTAGNAYWSRVIVNHLGIKEVHVVTNEFHVNRSKVIFEQVNIYVCNEKELITSYIYLPLYV